MDTTPRFSFKKLLTLENLPYALLALTFLAMPIVFIPLESVTFVLSKSVIIFLGTILAALLFLVGAIRQGSISFPKSCVVGMLVVLSAVSLFSAVFSGAVGESLFGYLFETGTFGALLLLSIATYLVSVLFKDKARLGLVHVGFFAVAAVLGLFYTARLVFGADFLSFGLFTNIVSNTIGKWNEVGIFFGLTALLSLITLEIIRPRSVANIVLHALLALSVFVLLTVNFSLIWWMLGAVTLVFFVHGFISGKITKKHRVRYRALGMLVLSVFFILPVGGAVAKKVSVWSGVDSYEVRPSWSATTDILQAELSRNPVLGAGPNRFFVSWQANRPDVNLSPFWNTNFMTGIGFIPTSMVELGALGILGWLGFLCMFLYAGYKALMQSSTDEPSRYFVTSTFFAALFLWITAFVYTPSITLLALTFLFTGLFVAAATVSGSVKSGRLEFADFPSVSPVLYTAAILSAVLVLGVGYVFSTKALASVYFQKAALAVGRGEDLSSALGYVVKANKLSEHDSFYRAMVDIRLAQMDGMLLAAAGKTEVTEAERAEFLQLLEFTVAAARSAVGQDKLNFENHATVGNVYTTITPLGATESYELARAAYAEALVHSPRNPALFVAQARLALAQNDLVQAATDTIKALELKPNYLDAIFLQAQISVSRGDLATAVTAAEQMVALSPNDPANFFRLGILKYERKDFLGAANALERSLTLAPVYANAKYFLGLSYARLNRYPAAVAQFEDLAATNPDSQDVRSVLANLRAGRDPFAASGGTSAQNSDTKDRLPIEE
jgi:tetratricopeptide (TPR) repeat protein